MAAALADRLRDVLLRVLVLVGERLIAGGLLERIEIGALHVLDDRELERFGVGRLVHDDRHLVQTGALRRAPAPLAGDDLESVGRAAHGAHDDRLDDAALADRAGELAELGVGEMTARIARIGLDELDRHAALATAHVLLRLRRLLVGADVADQRRETATEPRPVSLFRHRHVSAASLALDSCPDLILRSRASARRLEGWATEWPPRGSRS